MMKPKSRFIPSNVSGWMVDRRTRAVINTNEADHILYKMNLEKAQQDAEMDNLRNEVDELKALVKNLIKDKNE